MKECSKAVMRRLADPRFHTRYFVGHGLDIGGAPDPLGLYTELFAKMKKVDTWDLPQGDAQLLSGVPDSRYDFVHSSHCLEHMVDPAQALQNWFRVLKPGGHMIHLVPDEDLYEQGVFPSTNNADHKWTLTVWKGKSWSEKSLNLVDLLTGLGPAADIVKIEVLDGTHRYSLPRFDQTLTPIGEAAVEFIVRKRTIKELEQGGRLPPTGKQLSKHDFFLLTGIQVN